MRRIPTTAKSNQINLNNFVFNTNLHHNPTRAALDKRADNSQNQVSSTTPNVLIGPRVSLICPLTVFGFPYLECLFFENLFYLYLAIPEMAESWRP